MNKRRELFLRGKRFLKQALGKDVWQYRQVDIPYEYHGTKSDWWVAASNILNKNSIVYSIGIGEDPSFDVSLIKKYDLRVYAFDPTPESVAWVANAGLPENFIFTDVGITDYDGTAKFYRSRKVCHSLLGGRGGINDYVEVRVNRLQTVCEKNGHSNIDLLKMDIEGAEYTVLDDLLDKGPSVGQILVEFHHRFKNIGVKRTRKMIDKLNERGYKIFFVSLKGREYSFIHEDFLK